MSEHRWFVTAALDADTPLDGPFETRDACEVRCLLRTDKGTTLRAFQVGRLPAVYVPHLFSVHESEPRHLYKAQAAADVAAVARERHVGGGGAGGALNLPAIVHTYTRGGLLALCRALELRMPHGGADRAGIIRHMERELAALARGRASRE